jgi:hypothetical protein
MHDILAQTVVHGNPDAYLGHVQEVGADHMTIRLYFGWPITLTTFEENYSLSVLDAESSQDVNLP